MSNAYQPASGLAGRMETKTVVLCNQIFNDTGLPTPVTSGNKSGMGPLRCLDIGAGFTIFPVT